MRQLDEFVREIESIEHAKKTNTAPTPMDLDASQGNCHKCGKYGTATDGGTIQRDHASSIQGISAASRGILKRKNKRDTIHFNVDALNTELLFRTIHSVSTEQSQAGVKSSV